jgi:ABC-2 type transport system permease protein
MRTFLILWRRELAACFLSPVAYVTMVVFLSMAGWVFLQMVEGHAGSNQPLPELLYKVLVFFWLPILVTVITMRLFAEEKRSGALEVLMTAPVSESQVVWGKYAGAMSFLVVVALPVVAGLFILRAMSPGIAFIDVGSLLAGGLILLLLSALAVSIGLLVSLMTRNQIVAAICCFCGVLLPLLAGYLVVMLPFGSRELAERLSAETHLLEFARGSIDTRPIVLYVSMTAFVLFAAVKGLESRRWK